MSTTSKPWILATTILGSALVFIDGTAVNVIMPALQKKLGATIGEAQWVVESYALLLASLILVGGTLGDRYGRRKIYATGLVLFALTSIWCGLAPDIFQLIIARGVQGVGGALLVPGSLAIITASFDKEHRGPAIGTWSGLTAIAAVIGPLLGGWLVDVYTWRAVFYINPPIAAFVLWSLYKHVPESKDANAPQKLDILGNLLVAFGLGLLVFGLIKLNDRHLTDSSALPAIIIGSIFLIAFIIVEHRSTHPMMPLHLFTSRTFSGANFLTFLLYGGLSGLMFFVSFNLIQVQGYSATATGAALLPFIIFVSTLSRFAGTLANKVGAKILLIIGPVITACGFGLFALPGIDGSYWATFFPAAVVLGLGMSITVAPLTTTVMNAVDEQKAGLASGVNNAVSRVAALIAIAALGVVLVNTFESSLDERLGMIDASPEVRSHIEANLTEMAAITLPKEFGKETITEIRNAINHSFVEGFRWVAMLSAALALLGALSSAIVLEKEICDAVKYEREDVEGAQAELL